VPCYKAIPGKGQAVGIGFRAFSRERGSIPNGDNDQWETFLKSREASIGTSVGVLDGAKRAGKGRVGTIVRTYGHPDYLAVDVHFEDGSVELFWHHELRRLAGQPLP